MEDKVQMTNEEIAEQYEFLSGHPYMPVRYREEPRPIPRWMLGWVAWRFFSFWQWCELQNKETK